MDYAHLTERFNAVAQSLRADTDWRQQQKTCFARATAVEDIWTYPCLWYKWDSSKEKDLCFVFSDRENIIKNAAALFEQRSTRREREPLSQALGAALCELFEFGMQMMQLLNDCSTRETLTNNPNAQSEQTLPEKYNNMISDSGEDSVCTRKLNLWTQLLKSKLLQQNTAFPEHYRQRIRALRVNIHLFLTDIAFEQATGNGDAFGGGPDGWRLCYDFKFLQNFRSLFSLSLLNLELLPSLASHENNTQKSGNLYYKTLSLIWVLLYPICIIEKTFAGSNIEHVISDVFSEYKILNKLLMTESGELQNFHFLTNTNLATLKGVLVKLIEIDNRHLKRLEDNNLYNRSIKRTIKLQNVKTSKYFYYIWLSWLTLHVQNIGLHYISKNFNPINSSKANIFPLILNPESYRLMSNEFTNSNMEYLNLEGFWKKVSRESITAMPAPSPTDYIDNLKLFVSELNFDDIERSDSNDINRTCKALKELFNSFEVKVFSYSSEYSEDEKRIQQLIQNLSKEFKCEISPNLSIDIDASCLQI